jgi:lysozyme
LPRRETADECNETDETLFDALHGAPWHSPAMAMQISRRGLALIAGFESFVPYPYDDLRPMVKGRYREWQGERLVGTLTIGYGHTDDAGPPKITRGMRLTEPEAAMILDRDLDVCEKEVREAVRVVITQGQFDALVSFQFNTGALARSTLLKLLNRGLAIKAADEFPKWNKSKGRVLRGLTRRRNAERDLFLSDTP